MLVAKKEKLIYRKDEFIPYGEENNLNRSRNRKSKKDFNIKLKLFTFAFIALILCLTILLRYAQITQVKYDIVKLDNEIIELKKVKQQLAVELETIRESEWIEREAIERLGMIYPTNDQIIYVSVDVNSSDTGEIAEDDTRNPVFLKAFGDMIDKIIGFMNN